MNKVKQYIKVSKDSIKLLLVTGNYLYEHLTSQEFFYVIYNFCVPNSVIISITKFVELVLKLDTTEPTTKI